jgi:hypothetical protein
MGRFRSAGQEKGDGPQLRRRWPFDLPVRLAPAAGALLLRPTVLGLGGVAAAAGLGLSDVKAGGADLPALIASLGLLLSLLTSSWLAWKRPEREWYDTRASAESIKTLTRQFVVAGGEFALGNGAESESHRAPAGDPGRPRWCRDSEAAGENQITEASEPSPACTPSWRARKGQRDLG